MQLNSFKALSIILICGALFACGGSSSSKKSSIEADDSPSVARQWNDLLLDAIRSDYARPTVHARNLFHISSAMYDAWALYSDEAAPYLTGSETPIAECAAISVSQLEGEESPQEIAISYAAYRIIKHRFAVSPGSLVTSNSAKALMETLGYDVLETSTNISDGAAAVGNYIANCYIQFGLTDGSNEANSYSNKYYEPINPPLAPHLPGNPDIVNLDRWQPLILSTYIDQSGHQVNDMPEFLGPEWGEVAPFALSDNDLTIHTRDDNDYWVYHDPGMPPLSADNNKDEYKWGFSLVSIWSSHLSTDDGVMIDISPASQGNFDLVNLPESIVGLRNFYNDLDGGDASTGRALNPVTNQAYEPQMVARGDYARVLAEFWADGPDSETPPGHWFVLLNEVSDHEDFERKYRGQGKALSHLEWDVKAYFALGGAMHESAVAAWGIKGWYDYLRPVSAIRSMADYGQSTDSNLPSYSEMGIPLVDGYIELVTEGDALAGISNENVGKIKLYAWKGPDFIANPNSDVAGVDWILAEDWWPYQRPSFVTPPFAGYVSGHSTYSRAAAELLTLLTGSEYFPGGVGRFEIKANEFLVFEDGPSQDFELQWATYQDASDQCSLSRIWGGIHPPADDVPGRLIGAKIGVAAFTKADSYY